jgi:hypothetical protein
MSVISDSKQSIVTSDVLREFSVSVELYVPAMASSGFRKVSLVYVSRQVHLTAHSQQFLVVRPTVARRRKAPSYSKVRIYTYTCSVT